MRSLAGATFTIVQPIAELGCGLACIKSLDKIAKYHQRVDEAGLLLEGGPQLWLGIELPSGEHIILVQTNDMLPLLYMPETSSAAPSHILMETLLALNLMMDTGEKLFSHDDTHNHSKLRVPFEHTEFHAIGPSIYDSGHTPASRRLNAVPAEPTIAA